MTGQDSAYPSPLQGEQRVQLSPTEHKIQYKSDHRATMFYLQIQSLAKSYLQFHDTAAIDWNLAIIPGAFYPWPTMEAT